MRSEVINHADEMQQLRASFVDCEKESNRGCTVMVVPPCRLSRYGTTAGRRIRFIYRKSHFSGMWAADNVSRIPCDRLSIRVTTDNVFVTVEVY